MRGPRRPRPAHAARRCPSSYPLRKSCQVTMAPPAPSLTIVGQDCVVGGRAQGAAVEWPCGIHGARGQHVLRVDVPARPAAKVLPGDDGAASAVADDRRGLLCVGSRAQRQVHRRLVRPGGERRGGGEQERQQGGKPAGSAHGSLRDPGRGVAVSPSTTRGRAQNHRPGPLPRGHGRPDPGRHARGAPAHAHEPGRLGVPSERYFAIPSFPRMNCSSSTRSSIPASTDLPPEWPEFTS